MDNPWSKQISTRSSLESLLDAVLALGQILRFVVDEARLMGVDRGRLDNVMGIFLSDVTQDCFCCIRLLRKLSPSP